VRLSVIPLDVRAYRDDLPSRGGRTFTHPASRRGRRPPVLLVDDVLFNGRTTRAAIDAVIAADGPHRSSSRCSSIAVTGSCRSARTTLARTFRRRDRSGSTSISPKPMARIRSALSSEGTPDGACTTSACWARQVSRPANRRGQRRRCRGSGRQPASSSLRAGWTCMPTCANPASRKKETLLSGCNQCRGGWIHTRARHGEHRSVTDRAERLRIW